MTDNQIQEKFIALRERGYDLAMCDLYLVLADVITADNNELIKEIQLRMEHSEEIRKQTGFLVG